MIQPEVEQLVDQPQNIPMGVRCCRILVLVLIGTHPSVTNLLIG